MSEYRTSIGSCDADSITVLGQNLAGELMGRVSFGELAFWLVATRRPTPGQLRVFEAVLVALADHGFTPSAIAARLTLTGAPESIQGAVAAGLLGGGSRFLGVTEDCGRFLADALAAAAAAGRPLPEGMSGWPAAGQAVPEDMSGWPAAGEPVPEEISRWDAIAGVAVRARAGAGLLVPGLGHPVHKAGDPRTPALLRIAGEEGLRGPHLRLFEAVGRVHPAILGKTLPLNGAGVCGAALADLGFPVDVLRGFALLARTAGLVGHLAEELRSPAGPGIYSQTEHTVRYVSPPDPAES